ncbi:MAG: hypothetical protein KAH30_02750 [Caldisericia bacterium]|nr:hypothetical protein [Caldisericia bacterium]
MAKIQLSNNITLDIIEGDEKIKSFSITYREPSRKQQRALGEDNKAIIDLFKESQKLDRRLEVMEAKVDALKELEQAKELLSTAKKLDEMYIRRDKIEDQFEEMGGVDKMLEASQLTFDISVGGKDKKILKEFIETSSDYNVILNAIADDAKAQRGN